MSILSRLYVHPVKSMRGLQLSHALAGAEGLAFDRVFMLTDADGTFITARQFPQLLLFTPVMLPGGLHLTAPDGQSRHVRFADFSAPSQPVEVWGNHFTAYPAPEAINTWLAGYLDQSVTLCWTGEHSHRRVKRFPTVPLSFADGYPYLLISEASFLDLQRRCHAGVTLTQFRPNLVVTGTEAYAEDSWHHLRIGEVEFEVVKPCSRCVLTTANVEQGDKHPQGEPLRTLQGYRSDDDGNVDFGQNVIARTTGIVRVGDKVEVVSTRKPRRYHAGSPSVAPAPPAVDAPVTIEYQGRRFTGNQRDILLEQLELQGIRIPYSCRAGICGTCKVKLLSGKVAPLTASATAQTPWVLSCSCIPRGDVQLE
ncbi:YcbX family protein [Candidatus Sodalis endolongispinus]|uniref:YcbX family protein n=1 Tax=Candidatus Sodalis endolongispinus TaxID=2812662 RepID=A0ABS5YE40_9GAMM|nr:YcbX family protein [Candidatus Sodalis endolongispinus]MBT9433315.1 YcbX family protein [Candidatus Sodalis endolongispinus]